MANSTQFPGAAGPPLHAPIVGSVVPQNLPPPPPPSIPQFHSVVPMQPSQQYISQPPHQYHPVGSSISALMPPQSQQPQYFQPIQPPAGPPPVPANHVPVAPGSQVMHMQNVQPNMTIPSGIPPPPPPSLQGSQSYMSNPGNQGAAHLSSSYSFAPCSYGQPQRNSSTGSQCQQMAQMNPPSASASDQSAVSSAVLVESNGQDSSASVSTIVPDNDQSEPAKKSIWLEHVAANGRRYYYNKKTKRSTWEKPFELMTLTERVDATTDWKEYESPNGRKYYYNKVTKQSKWLIPEDLKLARLQVQKASFADMQSEVGGDVINPIVPPAPSDSDSLSHPPSASTTPVAISTAIGSAIATSADRDVQPDVVEAQLPDEPVMSRDKPAPASDITRSNSNSAPVEEATLTEQNATKQTSQEVNKNTGLAVSENASSAEEKKQDARNAFCALLESANIESDWTWEQVMRVIISDKRYGALKSLGERKQVFSEFLSQRKKQEAEKRRAKLKKIKDDFRTMLEERTEITSSTRWSKVISLLSEDERFKAVEHARDREDLYKEYASQLEKKERVHAAEEQKQNITEYRKFLHSCDFISASSQWRKVQDRLEADERCTRLEKIDRLRIFQEYVQDLEREEEEQMKIQKEEIRKAERRNRDEFRKLMDEHVSAGALTAKTNWRDYHSKVKDLAAFQAVSSNSSGFTAKELFDDLTEELQKLYNEDRATIKDALKSARVTVLSTWTLEDLKTAIEKDVSSSPISETNLKLVLDELLERVKEKEVEKEAKKLRRLGDAFFNLLCTLKDITASSNWEEVLPLFEHSEEYRSVGDKAFLREIFDQYITELNDKEKDRERRWKEDKARKEKDREKRSRDHKGKDRRHEKGGSSSGRKERHDRDEYSDDAHELSESSEGWRRGRMKGNHKKHHKRHREEEDEINSSRNGREHSRSSYRHSNSRKKSRQDVGDSPGSDKEDRRKRQKREYHNESRRNVDWDELEDGELALLVE